MTGAKTVKIYLICKKSYFFSASTLMQAGRHGAGVVGERGGTATAAVVVVAATRRQADGQTDKKGGNLHKQFVPQFVLSFFRAPRILW